MYMINIVRFVNKTFPSRVKTAVSSLKFIWRNYKAKQPSSFDLRSEVKSDVVVYRLENTKFFIVLNLASASQWAFWTYMGLFLLDLTRNTDLNFDNNTLWGKLLKKEQEYGTFFCAFSIVFGLVVVMASALYTIRSIRKIIIHKDGKYITLVTYNLPGFNTTKVPLNNLSSQEHRKKAKKYIPLKVKNKPLHYLIDVRGEFLNPPLFDLTVGVRRGLSK